MVGSVPVSRPSRWGDMVWLAFVVVQALDGMLSYVGVRTIGPWIEANPLVAWYASLYGPATAFVGAKLFAVACGTVLYAMSRHRTLALLTLIYLLFAVGPWIQLLRS